MSTDIWLDFGDGHYRFHLGLVQINALQDKCGIGIGAIYARTLRGRYLLGDMPVGNEAEAEFHLSDIIETIRQGLIGGGQGQVDGEQIAVNAPTASRLVGAYAYPAQPLVDGWAIAAAVLGACVSGYSAPGKKKEQPSPTESDDLTTPERSPTAPA